MLNICNKYAQSEQRHDKSLLHNIKEVDVMIIILPETFIDKSIH